MAIKGLVDTTTGASVDPETRYAAVSHGHAAIDGDVEVTGDLTVSGDLIYPTHEAAWKSGMWVIGCDSLSALATSVANTTMRLWPWVLRRTISIDNAQVEVTIAASAGKKLSVALYKDNGASDPTLVANTSVELAADSVGVVSGALPAAVTLSPGLYYWATIAEAQATLRSFSPASLTTPVFGIDPDMGTSNFLYTMALYSPGSYTVPATLTGGFSSYIANAGLAAVLWQIV